MLTISSADSSVVFLVCLCYLFVVAVYNGRYSGLCYLLAVAVNDGRYSGLCYLLVVAIYDGCYSGLSTSRSLRWVQIS